MVNGILPLGWRRGVQRWAPWVAPAVFGVLALQLLLTVRRYSVNAPYWDEWEFFAPQALGRDLDWTWLVARHNEHRIVLTKLLAWALYRLDGLDFRLGVTLNVLLFLTIPLLLGWLAGRQLGRGGWIVWPFLGFLLSTRNFENLSWFFQSGWHFQTIAFLLAAWTLFAAEPRAWRLALGCAALGVSVFSLATGAVSSVAVAGVYLLFEVSRALRGGQYRPAAVRALAVVATVALTVGLWSQGSIRPPGHPALTWPTSALFWDYLCNVAGLGLGSSRLDGRWGAALIAAVVAPLLWEVRPWRPGHAKPTYWTRLAVVAGTLLVMAAIAMGRAGLGLESAKTSRYFEVAVLLLPLAALNWAAILEGWRRAAGLGLLWLLCALAFWNGFGDQDLRGHRYHMRIGAECVREELHRSGPVTCPSLYPGDLRSRLDRASELDASFARELR